MVNSFSRYYETVLMRTINTMSAQTHKLLYNTSLYIFLVCETMCMRESVWAYVYLRI